MPPQDISRDNFYDERLREIMRRNESAGLYANQPTMLGGMRERRMIPYGTNAYSGRASFATSGRDIGGAWFHDVLEYIKPVSKPILEAGTERAVRMIKGSGKRRGGKWFHDVLEYIKPVSKPILEAGTERAVRMIKGSGVNRMKKAKRWTNFSEDVLNRGLSFAQKAKSAMGGVKHMKKPSSWITHVKAYQAKHGCSYKDALKGASASYKK